MNDKYRERVAEATDRFLKVAARLGRGRGESKHRGGRRPPRNLDRKRKAAQKRERQARKRSRLAATGRKHRFKGR